MAPRLRLPDGTVVPAITTITGRFKDSGALVHWAWRVGKAGEDLRGFRDPAAASGKVAHALIDAHNKSQAPRIPTAMELGVDPDVYKVALLQGQNGFDGFKSWAESEEFSVIHSEIALVSSEYRFGGVLDAIGRWRGRRVVSDWKLASGVYLDHLLQLAAERVLAQQKKPDEPTDALLLQIDKESGECIPHTWSVETLDEAFEMFMALRRAYSFDAKLQGMCREVAA